MSLLNNSNASVEIYYCRICTSISNIIKSVDLLILQKIIQKKWELKGGG